MQFPLIIASDFTGLIEGLIAVILWGFGMLFAIVSIAGSRSGKRRKGAGFPWAFFAIITTILSVLVQATVWAHYSRIEVIPLLVSLLPGLAGVWCLVASNPRRR